MAETATRERALQAALALFGQKGYDATSMNDIAEAIGIRAPSLYKHFASKEALFSATAPFVQAHYQTLWQTAAAAQEALAASVRGPGSLSPERLEEETLPWVRRELESGAGPRAFARQAEEGLAWTWDRPLELYEEYFSRLMERQAVKRADAHVMALEYLAPIFRLIDLSDRDPARRAGTEEAVRGHIRQFCRAFSVKERPTPPPSGVRGLFRR